MLCQFFTLWSNSFTSRQFCSVRQLFVVPVTLLCIFCRSKFINTIFMNYKTFLLIISGSLMIKTACTMLTSHFKCRGGTYPRSSIQRFLVPDDKVSWSVSYEDYKPPSFTSPSLKGKPYADLETSKIMCNQTMYLLFAVFITYQIHLLFISYLPAAGMSIQIVLSK